MDRLGWMGLANQLYEALDRAGCDKTEDGKFIVKGPITSFMGAGEEFVVAPGATFLKGGVEHDILPALNYGFRRAVVIF